VFNWCGSYCTTQLIARCSIDHECKVDASAAQSAAAGSARSGKKSAGSRKSTAGGVPWKRTERERFRGAILIHGYAIACQPSSCIRNAVVFTLFYVSGMGTGSASAKWWVTNEPPRSWNGSPSVLSSSCTLKQVRTQLDSSLLVWRSNPCAYTSVFRSRSGRELKELAPLVKKASSQSINVSSLDPAISDWPSLERNAVVRACVHTQSFSRSMVIQ